MSRIKTAVAAGVKGWRGPEFNEIAGVLHGRDITRGFADYHDYIPPQDTVLLLQGGANYELYEHTLRDPRVISTLNQRFAAVVSREWEVAPGGDRRRDRAAADFLTEALTHLRWDTLTRHMLYGVYYGYSVAEVLWARDGGHVIPDQIRTRNRRRFVFDINFQPRLLTSDQPNGEVLPPRKFWCFATGADNDDEPYGRGLAHWLYWPVWFKKNHTKFWLRYQESYAAPTPMGKYQRHATTAEREKLLQAVQSLHTESAIVIPDGMEIALVEASRAGAADYKSFHEQMDRDITTIVLSETMTTDDGSSHSQANVHMDVRKEIVEMDAHLVNDSFNRQVARWLTEWNFPGAAIPKVRRIMDDQPDLKAQAERDKIIFDMGFRPSADYIRETYNLDVSDELPAAAGAPPAAPPMPDNADFAEGDPEPLEALDEVLEAIDANEWRELVEPLISPILSRAESDPDDLIAAIAALLPDLDDSALQERLARILFVADAWGRLNERPRRDVLISPPSPAPDADRIPPLPADAPASQQIPDRDLEPPPPGRPADAPDGDRIPPGGRGPVPPSPSGGRPPPGPINLGYAVRLPPRRAIDYFSQKGFRVSWRWWETWQAAHDKAFTVAKATSEDILSTIKNALDKALAEGQTEAQFIKELQPFLEEAGWWGKKTVISPDGVEEIVQLGSPRRLKTIFRVNMRTSYAAGRYRQQLKNVDSRPYWWYRAVVDDRTRHSHFKMNGMVFRWDDEIWRTHYPPNGFNCRCRVEALSAEDLKELNLQVSNSAGHLRQVNQEVGTDRQTGEVIYRPGTRYDFIDAAGNPSSMTPDPGWNYNPGRAA